MANRYWKLSESMGYAGTKSSETIDLCGYMGWSEEEVESRPQAEVQETLDNIAWEQAIEKVESWAEPITEDEME